MNKSLRMLALLVPVSLLVACEDEANLPVVVQQGEDDSTAIKPNEKYGSTSPESNEDTSDASDAGADTGEGDAAEPLSVTSSDSINLRALSSEQYEIDVLETGKPLYVDRDYVFTDISAPYEGLCYIKTANDDQTASDADFLTIGSDKATTVYVGFDRTRVAPAWLSDWTLTGDQITSEASTWNMPPFNLYKRDFAAGSFSLGANEMGGTHYVVLLSSDVFGGDGYCGSRISHYVSTAKNNPVTIDVLKGQPFPFEGTTTVSLVSAPANGVAEAQEGGVIVFTPNTGYTGDDRLIYRIVDEVGNVVLRTVDLEMS